jgi:hypothetical protein
VTGISGILRIATFLSGCTYETIAGKSIIARQTKGPDDIDKSVEQLNPASLTMPTPQPATLGALAMERRDCRSGGGRKRYS